MYLRISLPMALKMKRCVTFSAKFKLSLLVSTLLLMVPMMLGRSQTTESSLNFIEIRSDPYWRFGLFTYLELFVRQMLPMHQLLGSLPMVVWELF